MYICIYIYIKPSGFVWLKQTFLVNTTSLVNKLQDGSIKLPHCDGLLGMYTHTVSDVDLSVISRHFKRSLIKPKCKADVCRSPVVPKCIHQQAKRQLELFAALFAGSMRVVRLE